MAHKINKSKAGKRHGHAVTPKTLHHSSATTSAAQMRAATLSGNVRRVSDLRKLTFYPAMVAAAASVAAVVSTVATLVAR